MEQILKELTLAINNIICDRKPLFIMEDGVPLFIGDTFYVINTKTLFFLAWGENRLDFTASERTSNNVSVFYKYFSTKENATKYLYRLIAK